MTETLMAILVVDDDANNRAVVAAQLKNDGFVVRVAASGEQALEMIDAQLPDLILLDIMMPGISGLDLAEILRAEERTATIPIIMLTALGDLDSRLAGLSRGAEEFLVKPVARAELALRIRNLLRLRGRAQRDGGISRDQSWVLDNIHFELQAPNGARMPLSAQDYFVIRAIVDGAGQPVSRRTITVALGVDYLTYDFRCLDTQISRLRRKSTKFLRCDFPVKTIHGVGYLFSAPVVSSPSAQS